MITWRHVATILLLCAAGPAAAATGELSGSEVARMGVNLFGGLALFLFGIDLMTGGLKTVAGEGVRQVLGRLTSNRFKGALTGAFVTAVIQSSTVTTVLVVGFTTAGLMSFAQSIGVIMGANIGTTITAQIIAFKVTKAALGIIAVGFALLFLGRKSRIRNYGEVIMGLGLVFFGMSIMSDAMAPLRSYQPFLDLMVTMANPLVGILVAAVFTALIHSSSTTTAIVIVLAGQGFITLPAGIALAFGANIGTCVTALLAAIGKPREALRAAVTHVLFNVAGVLLWIAFIDELAALVTMISPSRPDLVGTARLAAEAPRQVANAHTVFNVANTLIFIWMTTLIARLLEWLIPDRPLDEEGVVSALYLDPELISTPSLAFDLVRREIRHMGDQVNVMLDKIMPAIIRGNTETLNEVQAIDERVDALHAQIVVYLGRISEMELSERQTKELMGLMDAVNDLENIGDVIETNLVELGRRRISKGVAISEPTQVVLNDFHNVVKAAVDRAIQAVSEYNYELARSVTDIKKEISRITNSAASHEARRLVANEPHRIEAYTVEMDIAEKLQRIYFFARRMARTVTPETPKRRSRRNEEAATT